MGVRGLDHLAITVADMDATLDFYKRVFGAHTHYEDEFRKGEFFGTNLVREELSTERVST